jgi:hypothetical protein
VLTSQNQYSEIEFQVNKDYFPLPILDARSTMCAKYQNGRKNRKVKPAKPKVEAARVLRELNNQEAFYFYEAIGKPTGEKAVSLIDFLKKMESAKTESILFHLRRKDFENWIEITLGDTKLAKSIQKVPLLRDESPRAKIRAIVKSRVKELKSTPTDEFVSENLTLTSPSCVS